MAGCNGSSDGDCYCPFASIYTCTYTEEVRLLLVTAHMNSLVQLPALTTYDYIEHTHEMSRVNGANDALSIGASAGYVLIFVFVHVLLLFMSSDTHMHIHFVTYITVVFWIKLKLKMTISLTIQKADIRHFSVSGFAVVLKPSEPFDGIFYKRWCSNMILWLTAMNCYHVAQGKSQTVHS
jgi:hypothetical protein